ncbi:polysaccharide deacetylase family protein [uncultured Microbacterium sp.]|uniref:polysaccharide deacetylase family protein n=1 Tax=uncultured Microbacterium sp. TaxID=191216 RepID=UPI0028D5ED16|nr:polysaccharide deacetylase family protein [uncultured Microbacterium sp.]
MRSGRALLAMLVTAALLTACAPDFDSAWKPPAWPASQLHFIDQPPAPIDTSGIALNPQRLRNDALGVQARFAYLPGRGPAVDAFNTMVEDFVRSAIDARTAAVGLAYVPTAQARGSGMADRGCNAGSATRPAAEILADAAYGPSGGAGVAVVCEIEYAGGPFLAERMRAVSTGADGVISDTSLSIYVDTSTGQTAVAAELWVDTAALSVTREIIDLLRRGAGGLSLRPAQPDDDAQVTMVREALSWAGVDVRGGVTVKIPAGFDSAQLSQLGLARTSESMSLEISPDSATALLSAFGAKVQSFAGQPYTGPGTVRAGRERVDCALVACVALTYDDGPSVFTPSILGALAERHSAATFFPMGENAAKYRDVLARTVAEGHEVENHTWNHPRLTTLSASRVSTQIRDATRALNDATGAEVGVFRPPYGLYTDSVLAAAGLAAILWDVDTFDWQSPRDEALVSRAVDQPGPGSIVLMHDVQPGTARTAAAVYDGLIDRGFTLVTVAQLFGGVLPSSGAWRHGP